MRAQRTPVLRPRIPASKEKPAEPPKMKVLKRNFIVTGSCPLYNKTVNRFLEACDLGISGVFYNRRQIIKATLDPDCTPEKLDRQVEVLKQAYESLGWKKFTIEARECYEDANDE